MPQAPRKDGATGTRAQDKESKRARGAMSCAECRRLKLKCDKTVPCSSCKRRGCSAICPNGSLITGQGTRFVLADTEKLHQKIGQMSDRIRQLEDALAILQSTVTREPHPLLHRDLLKIKSSIELHAAVDGEELGGGGLQDDVEESSYIDAFGTLAIRDDGAATFYGRSAGSESLLIGEPTSQEPAKPRLRDITEWNPELPTTITNLSSSFPLASMQFQEGVDLDYLVQLLPPWKVASDLCDLYLEQAPWFFGAVTRKQVDDEILPLWYQEAPRPAVDLNRNHALNSSNGATSPIPTKGGAHDLALMFVIFCFGALTDVSLPPAPDNPDAEQYFQLTRAALTLEPVLDRPPSVATVQTLSLMAIYQGLVSGENSIESTWALMGIATKLAQSIGLHRDCARWKLTPAEVQKRRALFWELFITDCWQSLATGRLATFSLPFVDCELPYDPDQTMSDDGTVQPSFPFWKARFGAECVSAVVQGTLTSRAPKYSIILELDRKVRDMEFPLYAMGAPPEGAGLSQTMSHFMPGNYRELTLLYIHRCFFAHAISSHPNDPIKSQYAPSFLAGYRSACNLIGSLKVQFELFPAQIARFWVLWTHAFSSAVMLSSVVTLASKSKVAPAALLELGTACDLFERAAAYGGRATKFLPILQRLQVKARRVYNDTHSGIPQAVPNSLFSQREETKDPFSIFSGQTHTVATKASTTSSSRSSRPSPSGSGSGSRQQSDSPQSATSVPSFVGVHPSLVDQLNGFEGQLNAQIQNAYYVDHNDFAGTVVGHQQQQQLQQHQQYQQQHQQSPQYQQQQYQQQQQPAYTVPSHSSVSPISPTVISQPHSQEHSLSHSHSRQNIRESYIEYQQPQTQSHLQQHHQSQSHQTHYQHQSHNVHQSQPQPQPQQHEQPQYQPSQPQSSHPLPQHQMPHPQHPLPQHQLQSHHQMYNSAPAYVQHPNSESVPSYSPTAAYEPEIHSQAAVPQYWTNSGEAVHYQQGIPQQYPASALPQHIRSQDHYTPEAALRGIAADDHSLQETWQSYMYNVGSPRQFLET